jgi:leucyl/phenylalanyl-tRNA--protein transferase
MLTVLDPWDDSQPFPPVENALADPNGLLAVGGRLSVERLKNAYYAGVFPWYGEGDPVLWWSPDPRLVLWPERLHISRSLRKVLDREVFSFSFDKAFESVIAGCAEPRRNGRGTWLTREMRAAYIEFHRSGYAHSFEAWREGVLVGGLYGVALGRMFYGESMFHRITNASKAAFVYAVKCLSSWGYRLVDGQVYTDHLVSFGAETIPRTEFLRLVSVYSHEVTDPEAWLREPVMHWS